VTESELRLKCLELALVQAKNEGKHGDIESVAKIATRFYNLTIPRAETPEGTQDKSDEAIFD
jgi:hypothetical protein